MCILEIRASRQSISPTAIGASAFLQDSAAVTQQRASCCRDQVYPAENPPASLRQRRLIFATHPILITIQRRSSAGAGHWLGSQSLSGVSRPVSRRGQTWPGAAQKEEQRGKRSMGCFFFYFYKHHLKGAERRSSFQGRQTRIPIL